jgi:hypothetical protein
MSIKNILIPFAFISILLILLVINPTYYQPAGAKPLPNADAKITVLSPQEAQGLIKSFKQIAASNEIMMQFFGKSVVENILKEQGCVEVKLFYGKYSDGKPRFVLQGIDKKGKRTFSGIITRPPCPPICNS